MGNVSFRKVSVFQAKADAIYKSERERIIRKLPNVEIHHIGSTSIPGSYTKGDEDIVIRSF